LPENVLREEVDETGHALPVEIGACVDPGEQAPQLVRISLLEQLQRVVEDDFDVIRLRPCPDVLPVGFFWHEKSSDGAVLIRVSEERLRRFRVFREVVAAPVSRQGLELVPAPFEPE
jgi:hypothetical protein